MLAAGGSKTVTFPLTDRDVSVWKEGGIGWTVMKGSFGVVVGASSRDVKLQGKITVV